MYSKVIQVYIYMYSFFFSFFPHVEYEYTLSRELSRVPGAIQ